MKRFSYILLAAFFALAASCGEKNKTPETPSTLEVSPAELSFTYDDASNKLLLVKTTGSWTATASDSWIHLDKTSGTTGGSVTVTVDVNDGTADRTGTISFTGAQNASVTVTQAGSDIRPLVPQPAAFDGNKLSSTTYQLLVYSFADSDGNGVGDFKGIESRLDYLDALGATALWLSPSHPTSSYHGYDVDDYFTVNPLFGTEQDFKDLVDAAHAKGIKIYMDYVLNHSGRNNEWFQQAQADASSPYRDYYFFSSNPSADYKTFPMLSGSTYKADEWKQVTTGSPRLTVTKTDEAVTSGNSGWNLWFWQGSGEGRAIQFKDGGDGTLYLVMDISGSCGLLVRKYMSWDSGSKFGAVSGKTKLSEGESMDLTAEGADISFTGSGRYRIELSNVSTETLFYMGCFSESMPDLNYGAIAECENNALFLEITASADKWLNMGVDGFRLDAVRHICGGLSSWNNASNITFLQKWYDHCNATYKAAGHSDDIFMVGEVWEGHSSEKQYYKGLTSCFEFDYFGSLTRALGGSAGNYVSEVNTYLSEHTALRPDAVTSIFMTNHDQTRAAESLGKNVEKEKQAAAMMLTTPGKPFIYQGEELGYWGNKEERGDIYVRTPIMWDKAGKDCARKGVEGNVDESMLTASISVEAQSADAESLLSVYRTFSRLRNTYPALAGGTMTVSPLNGGSVASWYMTSSNGQKMLVVHNCGSTEKSLQVSDDISKPVAVLGTVKADKDKTLIMPARSSAVFLL
ncbi:MAG: alpha-amylase [Bacteroidales bacterium]|nr:alpha-amylase [Bacteroidales bacterium]